MKKKSLIITAVILVFILCMTACGKSSADSSSSAASAAATEDAASSAAAEDSSAFSNDFTAPGGETVDTGAFKVLIPEGWLGVVQTDVFGDQDEDGNYPVNPNAYGMIKGGKDDWDAFSKPTVYVYLTEGNAAESVELNLAWYDETKEIDVTVGGQKALAYEVWSSGLDEDDPGYTYHIVFLQADEGHFFQFNIPVSMDGEPGVSSQDADVMAIMESAVIN